MARQEISLGDPELESIVRMLAASANARILHFLVQARRHETKEGWRFLSEVAEGVGEAPGTVSLAIQKLLPLLEEKRHKGRRYFRTKAKLSLLVEPF